MLEMTSCTNENIILSTISIFPFGPFVKPIFLNEPVRVYFPKLNRNLIGTDNRKRILIYQWTNLINGEIYIGSASTGSTRLLSYFNPNVLLRNLPIYNSLRKYGQNNFCLAILEDLGPLQQLSKKFILEREQYYLDILFTKYLNRKLNLSPTAGSTLGLKHNTIFKLNRKGHLNPMFGKTYASEFLSMQKRDKKGKNNPMFGIKKSPATIAKLQKLVYVYEADSLKLTGVFSTIQCIKHFKIGGDTLTKYLINKNSFKGKIFSRVQLD
uniref:GIY-YIG endonuclease n=1 Tax=Trametes versicolor TaxID=5325 RepID=A0A7S8WV00_TRAVE|nr:GIY-YIG endonuclease [Trametes versicolor]QPF23600.1 GIY-YIG endonuclease [Trametes versicolor]WVH38352.1 GIY-YIG endonuclease [Trametes versicolor]